MNIAVQSRYAALCHLHVDHSLVENARKILITFCDHPNLGEADVLDNTLQGTVGKTYSRYCHFTARPLR